MIFAQSWSTFCSAPLMLALIATLGYFVGRLRPRDKLRSPGEIEIARALAAAEELDAIGHRLQKALNAHQPAVARFRSRLAKIERMPEPSWYELCDRADELLKPAMRLSSEMSYAYAEILQQTTHLATFADLRVDPLTGIFNRRAFDESMELLLAQHTRAEAPLSLAIIDVDLFKQINDEKGHVEGDRVLRSLGQFFRDNVRECDVLARYAGDEFVILMRHTELHAACNLTERIRAGVQEKLAITVSIGVAMSMASDIGSTLFARADAALYLAKGAGRNAVYVHEGPSGRIAGIKPAQTQTHGSGEPDARAAEITVALPSSPLALPEYQSEAC